MYRSTYDQEVTTFGPGGRLMQVEYAMLAVTQGSAVVGLRSRDIVVLASVKREAADLASHQKKLFEIDEHMGIAIAGLIADARSLAKYMRNECLNHKYVYDTPMPTGRLVAKLSDKAQVYTQKQEKRPYGVGLLVAGVDANGPHLYQTDPSGNFFEFKAQAMGAQSQAAKTYLEKHFEKFPELSLDELIFHAISSLKGSSPTKLTAKNVAVGFVSRTQKWTILEGDDIAPHVAKVPQEEKTNDLLADISSEKIKEEEPEEKYPEGGSEPPPEVATAVMDTEE